MASRDLKVKVTLDMDQFKRAMAITRLNNLKLSIAVVKDSVYMPRKVQELLNRIHVELAEIIDDMENEGSENVQHMRWADEDELVCVNPEGDSFVVPDTHSTGEKICQRCRDVLLWQNLGAQLQMASEVAGDGEQSPTMDRTS